MDTAIGGKRMENVKKIEGKNQWKANKLKDYEEIYFIFLI